MVRLVPKAMRPKKMRKKWHKLQQNLSKRENWSQAILEADKLLDRALKKKRMKGKSTGERLAAAQDLMSDNDQIWKAHNNAKKLKEDAQAKFSKNEVKKTLLAFGQALKDLGALRNGKDNGKKNGK